MFVKLSITLARTYCALKHLNVCCTVACAVVWCHFVGAGRPGFIRGPSPLSCVKFFRRRRPLEMERPLVRILSEYKNQSIKLIGVLFMSCQECLLIHWRHTSTVQYCVVCCFPSRVCCPCCSTSYDALFGCMCMLLVCVSFVVKFSPFCWVVCRASMELMAFIALVELSYDSISFPMRHAGMSSRHTLQDAVLSAQRRLPC